MKYANEVKESEMVRNHEDARAFKMSPEMELYTAVVTCALEDKFYESKSGTMKRISELVAQVNPEYVAKLAVYARTQMNLRSVPLLLDVELAKIHSGDDLVSRAVAGTVLRADEITELLSCYQLSNPASGVKKLGGLSRQIQNGLKAAFNRFDEYQFAKYDRQGQPVKLKDALFLVHPKAKDENQQAIFDKIVAGTLETPYTWETQLSALGQKHFESDEEKKAAVKALWEELIDSGRLGYMALIRNLRNILQVEVSDEHIDKVCARIANADEVARSRQLPFRFLAAYKEMMGVKSVHAPKVLSALEDAVLCSVQNFDGFDKSDTVVIASDVSGSMWWPVSAKSSIMNYEIGLLMSIALASRCNKVITGIFGNDWKQVVFPKTPILANTIKAQELGNSVGFSTNGYKVIEWLRANKIAADKVVMFTDCQMWDSTRHNRRIIVEWHRYKIMNPKAELILFDLSGYGQSPLNLVERDVYLIAGWSEKVFQVLDAIKGGQEALGIINNIVL